MVPIYFGIDLGGSKLLAVLADEAGNILSERILPVSRQFQPQDGFDAIFDLMNEMTVTSGHKMHEIGGIGIAVAGAINSITGEIVNSPQLPAWNNINLSKELRKRCRIPIAIDNDANLAALGEAMFGYGSGVNNLIYITVSTGIGAGIIINGTLYHGHHGYAGEVGQMSILENSQAPQGTFSPWESLCSGSGIAAIAANKVREGSKSSLQDLLKRRDITGKDVFNAAEAGDALAKEIIEKATVHLGSGFASLINIFDPERLIIGGGLSNQWTTYIEPALGIMGRHCTPKIVQTLEICPSYLGIRAGALGAIGLISHKLTDNQPN